MTTLNAKVILNVKTAADWVSSPLILLEGELGIESDTRLIKIGNGIDTWANLSYTAISDLSNIEGVTITNPTDGQVLAYSNGEWINVTPPELPADTDLSHYDNTTSGFITANDIPALPADTDLSHYNNTNSDFATVSQIPTNISQLNNDVGYVTSSAIPTVNDGTITIQQNGSNVGSFTTNQATNETVNITIPTNISAFNNDVGYLTTASLPAVNEGILTIQKNSSTIGTFSANSASNSTIDLIVPTKTSDLTNDAGFVTTPVNNGTLTINQDGNTIAVFNANSSTNVVANLVSGGGGGGGGGASYTSQLTVDSSLIPDTDSVYNLGSAAYRWTYLYTTYLSSGDGTAITIEQSLVPDTDSSYDLGSSSYNFNAIYTDSIVLNGNTYTSIPTDTSDLTNNAGFITSAALPTVNDATLTIQKNSSTIGTFTANSSTNATVDITVPTDTNDLTNGAGYITSADIPALPFDTDLSNYDNSNSRFITFTDIPRGNLHTNSSILWVAGGVGSTLENVTVGLDPDLSQYDNTTSGFITGVSSLNDIGDVTISAPSTNDILTYDGSKWINSSPSTSTINWGDIGGALSNQTDLNNALSGKQTQLNGTGFVKANGTSITYDNTTYQARLNGTGFVKASGTTISYDNTSYIPLSGSSNISGSLIPAAVNNNYAIGAPSYFWANGYFVHLHTTRVNSASNIIIGASSVLQLYANSNTTNSIYLTSNAFYPGNGATLGAIGNRWGRIFLNQGAPLDLNGTLLYHENSGNYRSILKRTSTTGGIFILDSDEVGVRLAHSATSWATASDRRQKKNIEELEDSLGTVNALNPIRFNYNEEKDDAPTRVGFIAQEVREVIPEAVTGEETETEFLAVSMTEIIPFLVKSVQELSSKVDELTAKIKVLEEYK